MQNTPCISRRRLVQCCLALFAFGGLARKAQAYSTYSPYGYQSLFGYEYYHYSICTTDGTNVEAKTLIGTSNGTLIPSGYMGVMPGMWNNSGTLLLTGTWKYSPTSMGLFENHIDSYMASGYYYSRGALHIYNGNGYNLYYTSPTPYVQLSPAGTEVCVNSRGETYGSGYFNDGLDLIRAIGVNGVEGYVRSSDLYGSSPATPEEAIARNDAGAFTIPVYDAEGVQVIDSFAVCEGVALSG